mmetsp:Transcript_21376/g.50243  ORF Transcript_21376/g.50243 Transcript_21376/m.50243 type:complete len:739 (-) Transcript_21376:10-2226(-)
MCKTSPDSRHVHVIVTKDVAVEHQAAWLSMAQEMALATWKEDGCLQYEFGRSSSKDKPNRFVIVEEWSSMKKLEAHFSAPHFTKLIPQMDSISTTVELDVAFKCLTVARSEESLTKSAASMFLSNSQQAPPHVFVTVTKNVPEDKQEEWLNMAQDLAQGTWQEDGCLSYNFVKSKDNPTRFVIVEEWTSMKHLEAHFVTPHFTNFVPKMDAISETAQIDLSHPCLAVSRSKSITVDGPLLNDRRHRNGRILVLYDTSTGSTQAIADLIAEGAMLLDRMEVRIRTVPGPPTSWEDATKPRDAVHDFCNYSDIYWADAVACGTPTNLGCISYRMKQFWDDFSQAGGWAKIDGKIGCAFTSQGGHGGGGELACMAMQTVLMNFGFSVFGITDYVGFKDTMHYGSTIAKKPRVDLDKMKCRRQGLRLAEMVAYYINGRDEAHPLRTKEWDNQTWGGVGIPPKNADPQLLLERNTTPHYEMRQKEQKQGVNSNVILKKALIFTLMEEFVHHATPSMASWVHSKLVEFGGWNPVVTDDSTILESHDKLKEYDLVVFLNNSGQIFGKTEPLLAHVAAGKPVVGVHAAVASFLNGRDASGNTIMEPTCDIFETIFGSHFQNHPPVQKGTVKMSVGDESHKLSGFLSSVPAEFEHEDEFFNFTKNVATDKALKDEVTVIAWADESTYEGGLMGEQHPLAWYREMGDNQARIFYTGLGHFSHFYNGTDPKQYVATILEAGLRYCCGYC